MVKENTRTLKNASYKKPSKKKSRKNSLSDTEKEMRDILDSASEDYNPGVRNFLGGNMQNQMPMNPQMPMPMNPQMPMPMNPQMPMPMNPMMPMGSGMDGMPMMPMPMQGMGNQMQMFSPANYDSIMLQSIAPLQTRQAIAPPSGLMGHNAVANNLAQFARQPGGMLGGGGIPAGNLFRIL